MTSEPPPQEPLSKADFRPARHPVSGKRGSYQNIHTGEIVGRREYQRLIGEPLGAFTGTGNGFVQYGQPDPTRKPLGNNTLARLRRELRRRSGRVQIAMFARYREQYERKGHDATSGAEWRAQVVTVDSALDPYLKTSKTLEDFAMQLFAGRYGGVETVYAIALRDAQ